MAIKFTSEEIALCVEQLCDIIRDRQSFLSDDEDFNKPFLTDIRYLRMAIAILRDWKNDPDFL